MGKSAHQIVFLYLIIPVCMCMLLSSCTREETRTYTSKEKAFSIRFPKAWEQKEGYMGTVVIALEPAEGRGDYFRENMNVVVEDLSGNINISDYIHSSLAGMGKVLPDFKVIERKPAGRHASPSEQIRYSYRLGTIDLESTALIHISRGRAYVVTCTAEKEHSPRYRKTFDAIMAGFRTE